MAHRFDRRAFLRATTIAALAGLGSAWPAWPLAGAFASTHPLNRKPRFTENPFSLGVASGYPAPGGVVLWTRLAPLPDAPGGGVDPEIIPVQWTVAADERMSQVVASGTAYAEPDWAHSVHVEVHGLQPARWYWYRFTAGGASSPVGRTRTAPGLQARPQRLRFAFASCQQYEQGWYGAHRHLAADDLDLAIFLGDYIYETSWGRGEFVRRHGAPEPVSLDDYRARYALYKSDPDLQASHAALPWMVTWDDHEVENDYANDRSENADDPAWFLQRRAAAYRAYYEHMPLPRAMLPYGPHLRLYADAAFGNLAKFHMLDARQYRSPQACPRPGRGGSNVVDVAECNDLGSAGRSMLGEPQTAWLGASLGSSRAKWNILAQQTLMAQYDRTPGSGSGRRVWTDGWDGYPRSRQRLLEFMAERKVGNPVVIGGDVHMFYVTDLKTDFDNAAAPVVATEFVGTSITSQAPSQDSIDRLLPKNPHLRYAETRHRGYTRIELTPERLTCDLRGMDTVAERHAACRTVATFVVEDGRPGAQKA